MADINKPKDGRGGEKTTAAFNLRLTPVAPLHGVGAPIDYVTEEEIEPPRREPIAESPPSAEASSPSARSVEHDSTSAENAALTNAAIPNASVFDEVDDTSGYAAINYKANSTPDVVIAADSAENIHSASNSSSVVKSASNNLPISATEMSDSSASGPLLNNDSPITSEPSNASIFDAARQSTPSFDAARSGSSLNEPAASETISNTPASSGAPPNPAAPGLEHTLERNSSANNSAANDSDAQSLNSTINRNVENPDSRIGNPTPNAAFENAAFAETSSAEQNVTPSVIAPRNVANSQQVTANDASDAPMSWPWDTSAKAAAEMQTSDAQLPPPSDASLFASEVQAPVERPSASQTEQHPAILDEGDPETEASLANARSATDLIRAFAAERDVEKPTADARAIEATSGIEGEIDDVFEQRLASTETPTPRLPVFADQLPMSQEPQPGIAEFSAAPVRPSPISAPETAPEMRTENEIHAAARDSNTAGFESNQAPIIDAPLPPRGLAAIFDAAEMAESTGHTVPPADAEKYSKYAAYMPPAPTPADSIDAPVETNAEFAASSPASLQSQDSRVGLNSGADFTNVDDRNSQIDTVEAQADAARLQTDAPGAQSGSNSADFFADQPSSGNISANSPPTIAQASTSTAHANVSDAPSVVNASSIAHTTGGIEDAGSQRTQSSVESDAAVPRSERAPTIGTNNLDASVVGNNVNSATEISDAAPPIAISNTEPVIKTNNAEPVTNINTAEPVTKISDAERAAATNELELSDASSQLGAPAVVDAVANSASLATAATDGESTVADTLNAAAADTDQSIPAETAASMEGDAPTADGAAVKAHSVDGEPVAAEATTPTDASAAVISPLARAASITRIDPTMHGSQFAGPPGGLKGLMEKFAHVPRPQLSIHLPLPPALAALLEKIPVRLRPILAAVIAILIAVGLFFALRPHASVTHAGAKTMSAPDKETTAGEKGENDKTAAKESAAKAEKASSADAEKSAKAPATTAEKSADKGAARPDEKPAAKGEKPAETSTEKNEKKSAEKPAAKGEAGEKAAVEGSASKGEKEAAVTAEVLPKQLTAKELKTIRAFVPATCAVHGEKLKQWNFNSGYLLCVVDHADGPATYVLQREADGFNFIGGSEEVPSVEGLTSLGVPDPIAKTLLAHLQK